MEGFGGQGAITTEVEITNIVVTATELQTTTGHAATTGAPAALPPRVRADCEPIEWEPGSLASL